MNSQHALPFLQSNEPATRRTGLWVAAHHPEWSEQVLSYVADQLRTGTFEKNAFAEIVLAYAITKAGRGFLAAETNNRTHSTDTRLFLLNAMSDASVNPFPGTWLDTIGACIDDPDSAVRSRALELVRTHNLSDFDAQLATIANNSGNADRLRLSSLGSLIGRLDKLSDDQIALVLTGLRADADPGSRRSAARLLTEAPLELSVKETFASEYLPTADALVLATMLQLFQGESDESLGLALVRGLEANALIGNLMTDAQLDATLRDFPAAVQREATALRGRLAQRDAKLIERFMALEPLVDSGDVGRGRTLFFDEALACSTCHAIGDEGGTLGPDLTTIGLVRSGHDLLEAIMFPSASLVPDYTPYLVDTEDDEFSGILGLETPEFITLHVGVGETRRIPKNQITEMTPLVISVMPEGLDADVTDEQLLDLIAFLRSLNNEQWLLPATRN